MNADPEVMRHLGGPMAREASDAQLRRSIGDFQRRGYGWSALERLDDGAVLGFTGLHHHRWFPDDVEVGWRLARSAWGQGYATEAATAWVRRAFGVLALPRLISTTIPANSASIAVMRRLGFELAKAERHEGIDVVVYARDNPNSPA